MHYDVEAVRRQFPILSGGICYLDSAATSQKPNIVLRAMDTFYTSQNANINRGVHALAEAATVAFEDARKTVQRFLGAKHAHEIIFTRNATEAINLVAKTFGRSLAQKDRIALTLLEHHSNIVPWLQLKEEKNITIDWIGLETDGSLNESSIADVLSKKPKLLAITGVSNVLGTKIPLKEIIKKAHANGTLVLVDAAQMAAHEKIDVQDLDCDFLAFSGHKVYGPTGIGVLYGKEKLLNDLPTFLGGGDMIQTVTTDGFTAAELPRKFEAGTPAIAEAVGLKSAIEWIDSLGIAAIAEHEEHLLAHALEKLQTIKEVKVLGPKDAKKIASCISFTVDGIHPHDLTQILSEKGVYLRAGHHCTQPLHNHLGVVATSRISVAAYNTIEEIDRFATEISHAISAWKK